MGNATGILKILKTQQKPKKSNEKMQNLFVTIHFSSLSRTGHNLKIKIKIKREAYQIPSHTEWIEFTYAFMKQIIKTHFAKSN